MGNNIVLPTPQTVPFTQYKPISRAELNSYYSLLATYNAPFKNLATLGPNNTVQLAPDYARHIYNPPAYLRRPPWVSSEVDVLFEQQIATYQQQLVQVAKTLNDGRMVRVINSPPEPQQPPASLIQDTLGVPPTPYKVEDAIRDANFSDDPQQQQYIMTWLEGMQYLKKGQDYKSLVFYNPPPKGADFATALRNYTIMYEQIRKLHAQNTGGEVFTLEFRPPKTASGEVVNENFTNMPISAQPYICINNNTEREKWYLSQVVDTQGKRNLQREFCIQKGMTYDVAKCRLYECVQNDTSNITEEPIADGYVFNQIKMTGSLFPSVDSTDYSSQTTLANFKQSDIDDYYNRLAKYNFNWTNNNGWRRLDNNKIYNPPIPQWLTPESATGADKQFLNAIDEFNTNAKEILQRFNNYEPMNLPADFGVLPNMPPYPNALYEMLEKPKEFVLPAVVDSIPQESGSAMKRFQIPVQQLPQIYNSVKKQVVAKGASASASTKPKCGAKGGSDACILYDDEVSPAAQKLLDDMLKKKASRVSSAGYEYAMSKPTPPENVISAKLTDFYNKIRPEILENIQTTLKK